MSTKTKNSKIEYLADYKDYRKEHAERLDLIRSHYHADCEDCRKEYATKKSNSQALGLIRKAALLLEANEHLSASTSALKKRAENRHAAKALLLEVLGMSEAELERIYWES